MRIIGIDYGTKRVGVAVSSEAGDFAMPHSVIKNIGDRAALVSQIVAIAAEKSAKTVVIGESKDYAGKPNAIMVEISAFKKALEQKGFSVVLEPEFMTSHQAERLNHELGGGSGMKDASAAALILQSFLDKQPR